MGDMRIPFNRPTITGHELALVAESIASNHLSGAGPFTAKVENLLQDALGVPSVLLTPSCTAALEMAALVLDIQPGDEVIVPAFTFVSTINAFVLRGARPVFADVTPDTLNLDPRHVADLITARTRVIVPVHYGGIACAMDELRELAAPRGIAVVEDNAHGLFGSYHGRPLGSLGCLAALSFHDTKNFTCGEGGALLINDPALRSRAEVAREKGTNRRQFLRGEIDRYTWIDLGSSYLPSDLQAAFLLAQLQRRGSIQEARRAVWQRYHAGLEDWAHEHGVYVPVVPRGCEPAYHLFHLLLPSAADRAALAEDLRRRGIGAVSHYPPLHLSDMGRKFGGVEGQCPVAEAAGARLLRLPFYTGLEPDQQEEVIDAVMSFTRRA